MRAGEEEFALSIQLTPQQQQALDTEGEELPRVIDPRTNTAYVLIPEGDYEAVREILEDERRQRAIRAVALRNAAGRVIKAIGYVIESDCEPV